MSSYADLEDSIHLRQDPADISIVKKQPFNHVLIYFIPGNPGLIEYYRAFLTYLSKTLDPDRAKTVYHVVGNNLGGFKIQSKAALDDNIPLDLRNDNVRERAPLGLRNQIADVNANLHQTIAKIQNERCEDAYADGKKFFSVLPVILVGHSVGAYILMETLAWKQRTAKERTAPFHWYDDFEILGGVCLFPTIVDLAKSPKGRLMSPLITIWGFVIVVQWLTYLLCLVLPDSLLLFLIKRFTGQVSEAADVTKAFLKSRHGVRQALHMARDELHEMKDDKWPDTAWDTSASPTETRIDRPNLYFYWGLNDHWIDDRTRDNIIAARARTEGLGYEGKPYMEIDTHGIPHDFCITPHNSRLVAEKVARYVGEIVEGRM